MMSAAQLQLRGRVFGTHGYVRRAIFTDTSAAPNPLYLTRNSKRLLGGRYRERKIIPVSIHWESQAS